LNTSVVRLRRTSRRTTPRKPTRQSKISQQPNRGRSTPYKTKKESV